MKVFAVWRSVADIWKGCAAWRGWREGTTGRGQDKRASPVEPQAIEMAWVLACRSVVGSAADRVFPNVYNRVFGTTGPGPCLERQP